MHILQISRDFYLITNNLNFSCEISLTIEISFFQAKRVENQRNLEIRITRLIKVTSHHRRHVKEDLQQFRIWTS